MNKHYIDLQNDRIRLEPLTTDHIEQMRRLSSDPDIWRWFTADLTDPNDLAAWMTQRLKESEKGTQMTYAVRDLDSHEIIGSSSYGHIEWEESVIEIGWTWLGKAFIGSGMNKHMKYLMLKHAFEQMAFERVELRTDEINLRSRRAIEKTGAQLDGIIRSQRFTDNRTRRRNTAVYGIVKEEWPGIKKTIFSEFA